MREIVSLQLGQLSNYVAAHFWNAQESYFTYSAQDDSPVDHDVHWRQGVGADGTETFLPRTVVYDLKGGFGSMRKINALYEADSNEPTADPLWPGPSVVHKQPKVEQSAYQQSLDAGSQTPQLTPSSVRYWSDFSRVYFHPKSLVQLYDFELNSTIMPFERFSMGTELFEALDREHDIVDRDFRPFVEECDHMQGIQVFTTIDDAWGGVAASYLDSLRDEYPKSCIWEWGLQSPLLDAPRDKRQLRLVNMAQSISRSCTTASMVVPLAVPENNHRSSLAIDHTSVWQVSAVFAAAIESATLSSRLVSSVAPIESSLPDMAESLNTVGNQTLARMRMGVGETATQPEDDSLDIDLFQIGQAEDNRNKNENGRKAHIFGQVLSLRGSNVGVKNKNRDGKPESVSAHVVGNTVYRRYESHLGFPMLDSYPRIYRDVIGPEAIDVQTLLSTDSSIVSRMKNLRSRVTWSVSPDERETLANGLAEIADAYEDDWSSGSDEGDDDL